MAFQSKAQMKKFQELVQKGQMKQSTYDEHLKATPDPENLPERKGEAKPVVDPKRLGGRYK